MSPGPARRGSYRAGLGFGAASFVSMALLGVVSTIVIARSYGITVLGQFALVTAPVNVVWYLSSARDRPAFVREVAKLEPRAPRVTGLFVAMLSFSVALTLVVSALGLLGTWLLFNGVIDQPGLVGATAVSLAAYLLVTNTGWNVDAVFAGFRAGRELFWIRLHQTLAFLAFGVVGAVVADDVWGLVWATAAASLTSLLHRCVVVRRYMRGRVSREEVRAGFRSLPELIRFGLKIMPGSIANGVSNESGVWVLGAVSSVATVGAYDRAWQLARRFNELNWRITEMLFPTLVERRAQGDHAGFDRALVETMRYCAIGMLLLAAAGGGAAHAVMALFGAGFDRAADGLVVMLLAPAAFTLAAVQRQALIAVDRPWLSSAVVMLRMVVTVVLIVALAPPLGITGAGVAMLAGAAASMVWMSVAMRAYMQRPLRALWPLREMAALALAYGAGFAAARGVDVALPGLAALAPALAAGTLAYAAVLLAAGGVNARDRERIRSGRAALARRRVARRGTASLSPSGPA